MMWEDEIFIYFNNLSNYYLFSVLLSFAAVLLTIYLHFSNKSTSAKSVQNDTDSECDEKVDWSEPRSDSVISKIKMARQKAITEAVILTEQQLEHEKEVENQQLNAIFNLLKEQQEKFQVGSMEELEDQLKLYR